MFEPRIGGFVYVLAMFTPSGPVFKIGMAQDVDVRLGQFATMLPYPCCRVFVLWAENPCQQERCLHQHFAKYRLRGEWFDLPDVSFAKLHQVAEDTREETPDWAREHLCALSLEAWRAMQIADLAEMMLAKLREESQA
jgi:hypothetical protein